MIKTAMWHVLQEKLAQSLYSLEPVRKVTSTMDHDPAKGLAINYYQLTWHECNETQRSIYLTRAAVALELLSRVTMIEAVGGAA